VTQPSLPPRHDGERCTGTIGHAAASTGRLALVDAEERAEDGGRRGEPGEDLVRGRQVMLGYLGDGGGHGVDANATDGWLRTGDIATIDEAARFVFAIGSRHVKYKGYQVPPAQLGRHLCSNAPPKESATPWAGCPSGDGGGR